jgi:hypothetical protein
MLIVVPDFSKQQFDLDKGDEFDDMILKHITTFYKNNIYR